jgi:uncharacterized protein (DUF1499 family)
MRAMTAIQAATGGVVALLLVIAAGPVFRTGVVPLLAAFGLLAIGAITGAVTGIAGLMSIVAAWRQGQSLPPAAIGGVACGLLAFGLPVQRLWSARQMPPIHDVSTDLADPPAFVAVLPLRAQAANPVTVDAANAPLQRRAFPDLAPLTIPLPPAEAFARALDAARAQGWTLVAADPDAGRIEASDITRWFGFVDDIVIRVRPAAGGATIDVRSLSRIGRGDLGTNAARIRRYLQSLPRA